MPDSKILVTGGAGFIGSSLVETLVKLDYKTIIIDNFNSYYDPAIKRHNIAHLMDRIGVYERDILDDEALDDIFRKERPDTVVHLAARAGVFGSIEHPELYEQTNVLGTINLLKKSVEYGVSRFVFGSSSCVYGGTETIPFGEDDPQLEPLSPYGITKISAEKYCRLFAFLHGLPTVCLRFFTVYGPRQRPEMAIHKFFRRIYNGETIELYGDGTSERDYTYVDDIVSGIINSFDYETLYDVFNLGESQTITLIDLVRLIESIAAKKARLQFRDKNSFEMNRTYADISKARDRLHYRPRTTIEEGVRLFNNWYQNTILKK